MKCENCGEKKETQEYKVNWVKWKLCDECADLPIDEIKKHE